MSVVHRLIDYSAGAQPFEGEIAVDDAWPDARPGILICPNWAGRDEDDARVAARLAELGYAGLAVDVYGKGVRGGGPDVNAQLMQPLLDDRAELQSRLAAAHAALCAQPEVDASRTAVIGYCFGGLCALDVVRMGLPVEAAVSFHGLFAPAPNLPNARIDAAVLLLHGWDDPMATPDDVLAVARELSAAGADWQLHAYGGTMHAFTAKGANDRARGTVYDATADRRSWQAMTNLLQDVFG